MIKLLRLTAILEAATGLAMLAVPASVARLLLGAEISGPTFSILRVAGLGFVSFGIACWPASPSTTQSRSAFRAMLTYNPLVTLYLAYLGITTHPIGPLLWPTVALHAVLTFLLAYHWNQNRLSPRPTP